MSGEADVEGEDDDVFGGTENDDGDVVVSLGGIWPWQRENLQVVRYLQFIYKGPMVWR